MTPGETAALKAIIEHRRETGLSPSLAEIATRCGWSGKTGAAYHVRRLISAGMLEGTAGSRPGYAVSRGYRPTEAGLSAVAAPDTCPACGQSVVAGARPVHEHDGATQ